MKIKRVMPESDSEDSLDLCSLRDKKTKKVMSKSMAEEIDAEAEVDGTIGLRIENDLEPKTSSTNCNLREVDLERALYRWYERYQEQRKEVGDGYETILETDQLMKKAKSFVQKLGGSQELLELVSKSWVSRWQDRYGVPKLTDCGECSTSSTECPDFPDSSVKTEEVEKEKSEPFKQRLKKKTGKKEDDNVVSSSIETADFRQALTIDTSWGTSTTPSIVETNRCQNLRNVFQKYSQDQVYIAFCFRLDWKCLPDRTLETSQEHPVWLLMAGNVTGRHRTRILVTGRHWRPPCLRYVNMLSQPVVYAGGGDGAVTADLLSWWFHREFIPAAEAINPRAVLVASDDFNLKPEDCVSTDGTVRLYLVNKNAVDWSLINAEFRTKYTTLLLRNLSNSEVTYPSLSIVERLNHITLKDVFPLFHKSWLSLRTETFQRCCDTLDVPSSESISANLIHSAMSSDLINLSSAKDEEPKIPRLSMTRRTDVKTGHTQEDRMILLELQWLAHDLGLEVTDDDLSVWALEPELVGRCASVKTEPTEEISTDKEVPSAAEAVELLSKSLLWMETLPLEPSLLMVVRDIIDVAKQASKMGLGPPHPGAALPFFCHNGEHLTQPPPAHMGIPPYQLDPKGASAMGEYWRGLNLGSLALRPPSAPEPGSPVPPHPAISPQEWKRAILAGLSRPPMYPFSAGGAYPYPMLSPEISQVAASWHTPGMYPISGGAGFRSPYPSGLGISSSSLPSEFYRFSPTGLLGPGHPGLGSPHPHHGLPSHPAIITPGPKQELQPHHTQADHNHRSSSLDHKNSSTSHHPSQDSKSDASSQNDKKKPHIKKPLNAFMLYMKEMRAKVVAECTLKESAAINQILGRRWHALGREEQAKYYELARRERQLHMQLYPDWSSRANSSRGKKRKRKQEANDGGNNMKKCRARYGLDQQSQWCKPCRRKKKCIRYMESGEERDGNQSEDNMESCGSVGDANTPPDDDDCGESLAHSMSSPGGLSGLSSLTSPSMILPSPSTSLASPSVSLASPCMSLQSPLTPPTFDMKPILPIALPPLHRNPVGTNPHDVNNPLSVNQLTGKCIKSEPKERSRAISVT